MANGEFSARKLIKDRKKWVKKDPRNKRKLKVDKRKG